VGLGPGGGLFDQKYIVEVIEMTRVIMAEIHIRDACDPSNPGDCAPLVCVPGAEEIEGLVKDFGVVFEEPGELVEGVKELLEAIESEVEVPGGLTCDIDGTQWAGSECQRLTGLDEEAIMLIRDAVVALQREELI